MTRKKADHWGLSLGMKWDFEKHVAPDYIRTVGSGLFSNEGFTRMFDELFALEYWHFGIPLFFDHRKLNFKNVTSLQLMVASEDFIGRNRNLVGTKIAVMFDESVLDLARRFNLITKPGSLAKVHLYLSEKEAIEWLTT